MEVLIDLKETTQPVERSAEKTKIKRQETMKDIDKA
jgi:hypothetical protein